MPDYSSLSDQITAVKSEITASLNASTYTAQDLVFIASALDKLGTMLGVNDIVAATAAKISDINTASTMSLVTYTSSVTLTKLTDQNQTLYMNSGSPLTVTVPPNSSQGFDIGAVIEVIQAGSGQVTFSAGSGVTINNPDSLSKTRRQYSSASLIKVATDTWILGGDLGL